MNANWVVECITGIMETSPVFKSTQTMLHDVHPAWLILCMRINTRVGWVDLTPEETDVNRGNERRCLEMECLVYKD